MIEQRRLMADPGTHVRQGDTLAVAVAAGTAATEPVLVQSGARDICMPSGRRHEANPCSTTRFMPDQLATAGKGLPKPPKTAL
jgi:hypothetical protein